MSKGISFHPQLIEDALNNNVPKELKVLIKPYHITKWKHKKPMFVGEEYYRKTEEKSFKMEYLKTLAIIRLYKLRFELTERNKKFIKIKGNEKRILRQVKKSNRYLNLKYCCTLIGISSRKFLELHKQQKIRNCTPEIYFYCNKRKKNQLTTEEVFKIKNVLEDTRFLAWPITRLHSYASRNKIVSACYNSWLMIKKLFEIGRNRYKPYSSKNKKGIRAIYPNQLLHTDVSRFVLHLNKKVYLFLMIDNYSRYIINAIIAEKNNHQMNIVHFIQSMKNIKDHKPNTIKLMSDKGSENTAIDFEKTVSNYGINHIIAQSEICHFSNSMVERVFASIKKFIRHKFQNTEISLDQLVNAITEYVKMHNFEFPLFKTNRTPHEIYWNVNPLFNYKESLKTAIVNRVNKNSKLTCNC